MINNNYKYAILVFIILICTTQLKGQSTTSDLTISALIPGPNLPGTGNDFIGWANGTLAGALLAIPELTVKNEENMPINFYTNTIGSATIPRMIIYEDPTTAGVTNAGFVGVGHAVPPRHLTITTLGTSLVGTTPIMTELLVAGGIYNDNIGRQTVAEFQSVNENNNSVGIGVRGSRNSNQNADCAYIDLKNYYKDGGCDFPLARMSADVRQFGCTDDASGYYRLKIADGTASGGYNLALFAVSVRLTAYCMGKGMRLFLQSKTNTYGRAKKYKNQPGAETSAPFSLEAIKSQQG